MFLLDAWDVTAWLRRVVPGRHAAVHAEVSSRYTRARGHYDGCNILATHSLWTCDSLWAISHHVGRSWWVSYSGTTSDVPHPSPGPLPTPSPALPHPSPSPPPLPPRAGFLPGEILLSAVVGVMARQG